MSVFGLYEHFIYAAERAPLDKVAFALLDLKDKWGEKLYSVPAPADAAYCQHDGCSGCDHHWLLLAYGSPERAYAKDGRDDIRDICERFGATYDGGGMAIG